MVKARGANVPCISSKLITHQNNAEGSEQSGKAGDIRAKAACGLSWCCATCSGVFGEYRRRYDRAYRRACCWAFGSGTGGVDSGTTGTAARLYVHARPLLAGGVDHRARRLPAFFADPQHLRIGPETGYLRPAEKHWARCSAMNAERSQRHDVQASCSWRFPHLRSRILPRYAGRYVSV